MTVRLATATENQRLNMGRWSTSCSSARKVGDDDRHVAPLYRQEVLVRRAADGHEAGHHDVHVEDGSEQSHLLHEWLLDRRFALRLQRFLHSFFLGWLGDSTLAAPLGGLA